MRYGPLPPRAIDRRYRAELLEAASKLPPDKPTPDWILFGESLDPTETFIQALHEARSSKAQR